jgi:hypothetical protein
MVMTSLLGIGLGIGVIACADCNTPTQVISAAEMKRKILMKISPLKSR